MTGNHYSALYTKSPDKAYRALFDEYCNYVYAIVYNKLHSCAAREDIEECVSDIFAEFYFKYDTESEYEGDLKGYIATLANRRAINKFHSLTTDTNIAVSIDDDNFGDLKAETDTQEESEKAELCNLMIEKINELGEPDSTIIIQKYYYNRSSSEIAKLLSMKSSAVRMRCGRAMKRLRKKLEEADITA